MNVYDTANRLAYEIKESKEYKLFEEAKQKISQNPELKSKIDEFEKECGRKTLVNKPYSGTQVIKDYGDEHIKTGKLIVYTSADSVFQIAACESIVSDEELYNYCKIARKILKG